MPASRSVARTKTSACCGETTRVCRRTGPVPAGGVRDGLIASRAPLHLLGGIAVPFDHETLALHLQRDRMPRAVLAAALDVEAAIRLVHLAERAGLRRQRDRRRRH